MRFYASSPPSLFKVCFINTLGLLKSPFLTYGLRLCMKQLLSRPERLEGRGHRREEANQRVVDMRELEHTQSSARVDKLESAKKK